VVEISGRKTRVEGTAALAATPDVVHVNAYAVFVEPREDAQQRYFGDLTDATGASVPARHGSLIAGL
jgi:hypothetical protein